MAEVGSEGGGRMEELEDSAVGAGERGSGAVHGDLGETESRPGNS
jgi:hypothetical protein